MLSIKVALEILQFFNHMLLYLESFPPINWVLRNAIWHLRHILGFAIFLLITLKAEIFANKNISTVCKKEFMVDKMTSPKFLSSVGIFYGKSKKFKTFRGAELKKCSCPAKKCQVQHLGTQVMELFSKRRWRLVSRVTRLGDFLHFGQPFKADCNNQFTQITHIVRQFLYWYQNH